jgi:hypothetical protein
VGRVLIIERKHKGLPRKLELLSPTGRGCGARAGVTPASRREWAVFGAGARASAQVEKGGGGRLAGAALDPDLRGDCHPIVSSCVCGLKWSSRIWARIPKR